MEIPEDYPVTEEERKTSVWKLLKSLYGLKTNPKIRYETFRKVMNEIGLIIMILAFLCLYEETKS